MYLLEKSTLKPYKHGLLFGTRTKEPATQEGLTGYPLIEGGVFVQFRTGRQCNGTHTSTLSVARVNCYVKRHPRLQLGDVEHHLTTGADVVDQDSGRVPHLGCKMLWQPTIKAFGTIYSEASVVLVCYGTVGGCVGTT